MGQSSTPYGLEMNGKAAVSKDRIFRGMKKRGRPSLSESGWRSGRDGVVQDRSFPLKTTSWKDRNIYQSPFHSEAWGGGGAKNAGVCGKFGDMVM